MSAIYNEDCLDTMRKMPNELIDLTVTSPPYDDIRNYEFVSKFDFAKTADELYRITKQGGVVVWIVGDQVRNYSESGTSFKQALGFMKTGFSLFDTMIYQKPPRPVGSSNLGYFQTFEYMFVLSRGKPKATNLIRDRKNSSYVGYERKHYRDKDGNRHVKHYQQNQYSKRTNIWYFLTGGTYTSSDKIAFQHPAILHEGLVRDHIITWSNEGDLVYDPFMGSGTTAKMAILTNRKYLGSEINKEYYELSQKRLDPYIKQTKLI